MWGIAALLLIAFALTLFAKIAKTRWMGVVFVLLGMGVWFSAGFWCLRLRNEDALFAIMTFPMLSSVIADLIAIPILRRRVIPPCVRVKRHQNRFADILLILASFLSIAFIVYLLVAGSYVALGG